MGILDKLRSMLAGPTRAQTGGDPEVAVDPHEASGVADEGESDVRRVAEAWGGGGAYLPGQVHGAAEAAEAAEADLSTEEAPPDSS